MEIFLSILIILASVLLVLVVFIQNPKGGGLSSDFGAAHQIGGVKQTTDIIEKATWSLAGIIMVCSIMLTISSKPKTIKTETPAATEQNQTPGAPATPGK